MRRITRALGALLALTLGLFTLGGCGFGGSSDSGTYEVVAHFERAVALYVGADVQVLGVPVGEVTDIEIGGNDIVVTMRVDDEVPLRADVLATIVPTALIGDRTVVLGPAWKPGAATLARGSVIPLERTVVPVEPDEALGTITDVLQSLDPSSVSQLLEAQAEALDGNGATINRTLRELAELLPYLAEQDDELLAIAADVGVLADVVRARDTEIGDLLEDFSLVARTLAEEREAIVEFIDALTSLAEQGTALLESFEVTLPDNLDTTAAVALTLQVNTDGLRDALIAVDSFQNGVIDAYDPETQSVRARFITSETALGPLLAALELLQGVGG